MLRHLVTLKDGRKFRFLTEDRASRFAAKSEGLYGGLREVPKEDLPPCLR